MTVVGSYLALERSNDAELSKLAQKVAVLEAKVEWLKQAERRQ